MKDAQQTAVIKEMVSGKIVEFRDNILHTQTEEYCAAQYKYDEINGPQMRHHRSDPYEYRDANDAYWSPWQQIDIELLHFYLAADITGKRTLSIRG